MGHFPGFVKNSGGGSQSVNYLPVDPETGKPLPPDPFVTRIADASAVKVTVTGYLTDKGQKGNLTRLFWLVDIGK